MRYKNIKSANKVETLAPGRYTKGSTYVHERVSYEEWNCQEGKFDKIVQQKILFKHKLLQEIRRSSNGTFEIEEFSIEGDGKRYILSEDSWNGENYFDCYELDKNGEVITSETYDFYPVYMEKEEGNFELLGYDKGI